MTKVLKCPLPVGIVVSLIIGLTSAGMRAQTADSLQMWLNQDFGNAVFSNCRLTVTIYQGAGRADMWCAHQGAVTSTISKGRTLTAGEANQFLTLSRASDLFGGGHVGTDPTAGDGVFETLKLTQTGRTVVLVSSGNPTFTTGSRHELLTALQALLDELRNSELRKNAK